MPDVITANRLTDGVVVFQTSDESWAEDFNRAAVLPDPQATAEALKRAKEDEATISSSTPMPSWWKSVTAISLQKRCAKRSGRPGRRSGAIWGSRR